MWRGAGCTAQFIASDIVAGAVPCYAGMARGHWVSGRATNERIFD